MILLPDGTPYEGPVAPDALPPDPWEEAAARILGQRLWGLEAPATPPESPDRSAEVLGRLQPDASRERGEG